MLAPTSQCSGDDPEVYFESMLVVHLYRYKMHMISACLQPLYEVSSFLSVFVYCTLLLHIGIHEIQIVYFSSIFSPPELLVKLLMPLWRQLRRGTFRVVSSG